MTFRLHLLRVAMQRVLASGVPTAIVAGLVAAVVVGAGSTAAADPGAWHDPIEGLLETQLENGMRVVLLEDHRTPVVAVQVWVDAGSSDESFYTGIAHLFEHMMFKGSKNIEPEVHAQLINERGGQINAYTSHDVTVYHEDVTSESLPDERGQGLEAPAVRSILRS